MAETLNITQTSSLARFDAAELNSQPAWLAERRRGAINRFGEIGFPTRRDEEWRSTPIAPIVETPFVPGDKAAVEASLIDTKRIPGAHELVFINGFYAPELFRAAQLPDGVVVTTLEQAVSGNLPGVEAHLARHAPYRSHAFAALNTASIGQGGVFISIPRNIAVESPIHLVFVSQPGADATVSHPRVLIVAGEGAQATVVERYEGPEGAVYFTNAVTEVVLGESAVVDHYKVQQESKAAFHMASIQVQLSRASTFASHSFGFGASIARNDIGAFMGGEGAEATLNGLVIASGRQLMDSHTTIDHALPHCPSHEMYKHILDGHARAVFNGKIFVRLDAQKTDAKQSNQTLLLSPNAQIDTKPQLEIFADDVRCTHGATVGQLRDDQLFYLRARGIGKEQAQDLLVYAFAADVISRVKIETLREQLDHILLAERHIEGLG